MTLEAREQLAKALFLQMEEEVKEVRRKYMGKIKALYTSGSQAQEGK